LLAFLLLLVSAVADIPALAGVSIFATFPSVVDLLSVAGFPVLLVFLCLAPVFFLLLAPVFFLLLAFMLILTFLMLLAFMLASTLEIRPYTCTVAKKSRQTDKYHEIL
jgi:hypothetical protein